MHGKTLSSENKGLLHIPIDKTRRIFERIFVLMGHLGGKQEGVSNSPQWDGFLEVLNTSDLESLSLVGVENLDQDRTQRELTQQIMENLTMIMDQIQTKSIDPE